MKTKLFTVIVSSLLVLNIAGVASANFIVNGTFDTNLSSWSAIGNNTPVLNSAHIGAPGPDGVSSISQAFAITGNNLHVSFDYVFFGGSSAPAGDIFTVIFYGSTALANPFTQTHTLINETYPGGPNSTLVPFDTMLTIPISYNFAQIAFILDETPTSGAGTRVELDNVIVEATPIPEPTTMLLLGTGLVGVAGSVRRKKKKNQA